MSSLKILLAGRPRSIQQLVGAIAAQPDMEIVGSRLDPMDVLLTAKMREADIVIMPLDDSAEPGLVSHLFAELPDVTVLMLSSTRNAAYIVQRCPWRRELFNLSEDYIVRVLRRLAQEPCGLIDDVDEP